MLASFQLLKTVFPVNLNLQNNKNDIMNKNKLSYLEFLNSSARIEFKAFNPFNEIPSIHFI